MIFEMPLCNGCRTCEMACSFKRKGEFTPSLSAIKIQSQIVVGRLTFLLMMGLALAILIVFPQLCTWLRCADGQPVMLLSED